MAYQVTTFDVCSAGFERLRTYEEFIVVACIDAETGSTELLLEQWNADLQSCERPDGFDFEAAREAIQSYAATNIQPLFNARSNPFNIEASEHDGYGDENPCNAYLFIRVDGARFEVWDCDSKNRRLARRTLTLG